MSFKFKGLAIALVFVGMSSYASAAITTSTTTTAPTGDVLASFSGTSTGSQATFAYRNADDLGTEGTRGRGATFAIDLDGANSLYNVSTLTLGIAAARTIPSDATLTLDVFSFGTDPDFAGGWTSGDGASDGDLLDGTIGTPIATASFDISGASYAATDFIQFDFEPGDFTVTEDSSYGFFLQYSLADVTGLTADVTLPFDTSIPGSTETILLNTAATTHGASTSRSLNFTVQGVAVPEPSSLVALALTGIGLVSRRRRS